MDSLQYSIVRGNVGGLFDIDADTGIIYTTVPLDAEKGVRYILYVRAMDLSERHVDTSVEINVINVNDNKPTFQSVGGLIEVVVDRAVDVQTRYECVPYVT